MINIIHITVSFLVTIGPFLFTDRYILYFIIILDIAIVYNWYLYGGCFLTIMEQKLCKAHVSIPNIISHYLGLTFNIADIIPFLSVIICLYRIDRMIYHDIYVNTS